MERNKSKISILDLLIPGEFCTSAVLYGAAQSGKTTLLADDLNDKITTIIDTTRTFPFHTEKKRVITTDIKEVLPEIEEGRIIVVDDIFVFNTSDIRQMTSKAMKEGARLILVSQIRSFNDNKSYPYMDHVVRNMNVWLKMERYEVAEDQLSCLIKMERARTSGEAVSEWIKDGIQLPVYITNQCISEETYIQLDKIIELNEE